jgi:hypothetical protein
MNCTQARDAMLVAEPEELHGAADSLLARHVASCDECRATAQHLSRDLDRLSVAVRSATRVRANRRRLVAIAVGIPMAASLVVGISLASHRDKPALATVVAKRISVDVARGQQAAVFNTNDPNVTVVWLSPGGDP